MSYILDALKKSDQQRQRGVAPTLLTVQTAATVNERPKFPLNGVLVAVLLCAGIVVGWLRPWQSEDSGPALQRVSTHPVEPSSRTAVSAPVPPLPHTAGSSEQVPVAQVSTSSAQSARLSAVTAMQREAPALVQSEPHAALVPADTVVLREAAIPSPDKKELASPADAGQGKRVMALNELPPSVQQEIPSISISFHVYSSKPKDRRVMINGEMVGQGEQLAPGLSLEEITPDGVIFGYKGYRFRRGVR